MTLNEEELKHYWNKVDKKAPVIKIGVLVMLCAVLAYLLSHIQT